MDIEGISGALTWMTCTVPRKRGGQRYRIFFSPKKFTLTHSLDFGRFFFSSGGCFFFRPDFFQFLAYIFFPKKVSKCTHSLKIWGRKKNSVGKKNHIFTHSLKISRKVAKSKLFRGKKYGTFGEA